MSHSEQDEENAIREEELLLRDAYLRRVEELVGQLRHWKGGCAVVESYSHVETDSPFVRMPENSVLQVRLTRTGHDGDVHLRCIACWSVMFVSVWTVTDIQVHHFEEGLAPLVLTDGERLHVECLDAEIVAVEGSIQESGKGTPKLALLE
jgi:hypothetical protein